jgi:hypothetical protein
MKIPSFGKALASTEKKERDEAVQQLKIFLQREIDIDATGFLQLWKGLFYCTVMLTKVFG